MTSAPGPQAAVDLLVGPATQPNWFTRTILRLPVWPADEVAEFRSARRSLVGETAILLGLSLGASALWAIIAIVDSLTKPAPLNEQTTSINNSVVWDRPWLDLIYQLYYIVTPLVAVVLALFLLAQLRRPREGAFGVMGLDCSRPWRDLGWSFLLAGAIGIPGLALYVASVALNLNLNVSTANLVGAWWTIPVYILRAAMNGALEEIVMVGYLLTRWRQAGWNTWAAIAVSALIRGTYHLYQGFGGFIGNAIMGAVFGWFFAKTKRVWPLVVAHTILDIVSFVGYPLLGVVMGRLGLG